MLTDVLSNGGMEVPSLKEHPASPALLEKLFAGSSVGNPIDFLATGTAEQLGYIIDTVENEYTDIDFSVVIFGSPGLFSNKEVYDLLDQKMRTCKKPIFPVLPSIINVKSEIEDFIAKGNIITSYMTEVPQPATSGIEMASLLPTNPQLTARYVMGKVIVRGESMGSLKLTVCNLAGQVLGQQTKTGNNYSEFAVDDLQPGCYIARITDEKGHYATCKFVKKQ